MLPDTLARYSVVLVFLLEVLALGVMAGLFVLFRRYHKLHQDYAEAKRKLNEEAEVFRKEAQDQASEVVKKAQAQAEEMLKQANSLSQQFGEEFKRDLGRVAMEQATIFKQSVESARQETTQMLKQVASETRGETVKEVQILRTQLVEQVKQAQVALSQSVAGAYAQVEGEVEKYKRSRLKTVEAKIVGIVAEVAKQVLPQEVSLRQSEELVMAALKQAMAEGVFAKKDEVKGES